MTRVNRSSLFVLQREGLKTNVLLTTPNKQTNILYGSVPATYKKPSCLQGQPVQTFFSGVLVCERRWVSNTYQLLFGDTSGIFCSLPKATRWSEVRFTADQASSRLLFSMPEEYALTSARNYFALKWRRIKTFANSPMALTGNSIT